MARLEIIQPKLYRSSWNPCILAAPIEKPKTKVEGEAQLKLLARKLTSKYGPGDPPDIALSGLRNPPDVRPIFVSYTV